jgi:hypothetical protein
MGHPSLMGFPPPSHNGPQPPEQGGGFGPPPQGFGPPSPPGDGYGYPQQGGGYGPPATPGPPAPPGGGYGQPGDGGYGQGGYGQGGYGQGGYGQGGGGFGQPGGFGPGGFPPPPPPDNTKRNVWIAVGTVVVVVGIIAGVVVANSGGDDKKPTADHSISMPSTTHLPSDLSSDLDIPTDFPSLDLPTDLPSDDTGDSGDTDEPSSTPTDKEVPYVSVSPGKCFDAPSMTHTLDKVTVVSCSSPHDAQAIANKTLTGTFTDDQEIEDKAFDLCKADAKAHVPSDGKTYYEYVLYPQLITYELQKRDTITCALSVNDGSNNKKLTGKLS